MTDERLLIVCTDKGQHAERRITFVRWHADTSWTMPARGEWMYPQADAGPGQPRGSYVFYCTACGRHPMIAEAKWEPTILALRRADVDRLDISRLPF